MKPTEQQKLIIGHSGNAVIIAAPGSGKTFVVSERIKILLNELEEYQGLIAISYTNKASNELRERSLRNGINPKASFFGTIDKFFIAEIIVPFGKHIFGIPTNDISVVKIETLEEDEQNLFGWFNRDITIGELTEENIDLLKYYFKSGVLLIETIGVFANYIFSKSLACKKYLTSRYKYIFIDEYQDSGINQHEIFLKINELGILGVAVGDLNQSIYAFSGKDSKFLTELTLLKSFKLFKLNKNHRCHPSIINYSNYLLDPKTELIPTDSDVVYFHRIEGNEINIAKWIDDHLDSIKKYFTLDKNNKIAILTRGNRTIGIINENLKTPNKVSLTTDLDTSLNIWSGIFSNLLHFSLDNSFKFIEVVEEFTSYDRLTKQNRTRIIQLKSKVIQLFSSEVLDKDAVIKTYKEIAEIIAPNSVNEESLELLKGVLNSKNQIESYKPADENEINIMTLHKSKGLEFDAVIHLDLYEWVMPFGAKNDQKINNPREWIQDLNLHYVGITRAKKACLLISSTQRTNNAGEIRRGFDSEFLWKDNIENIRFKKAD